MQALTKAKQVERKPMTFLGKIVYPGNCQRNGHHVQTYFQEKATINYPEKTRPFSPVFRGVQVLNRDEEGRERCTACGLCAVPVRQKPLPWKLQNACRVKKIYTGKKNMQPNMKSICCVVFFVDCVKKPVRKMLFIYPKPWCLPITAEKHLFMENRNC